MESLYPRDAGSLRIETREWNCALRIASGKRARAGDALNSAAEAGGESDGGNGFLAGGLRPGRVARPVSAAEADKGICDRTE